MPSVNRIAVTKRLLLAGVFCVGVYLLAFCCVFELFGFPARNNERGWLGPTIRNDSRVIDIGKVNYYESDDVSLYRAFKPLCKAWLFVNGL